MNIKIEHPIDLLSSLGYIEYGWWDFKNNKAILPESKEMKTPHYYEEHCHILRPKEVYKRKIASCWDILLIAYEELAKFERVSDIRGFYTEYDAGDDITFTHTDTTYKWRMGKSGRINVWYWVEYFHPYYGVNGPFFSERDMYDTIYQIESRHIKNNGDYLYLNTGFDIGEIARLPGDIMYEDFIRIVRGKNYTGRLK